MLRGIANIMNTCISFKISSYIFRHYVYARIKEPPGRGIKVLILLNLILKLREICNFVIDKLIYYLTDFENSFN